MSPEEPGLDTAIAHTLAYAEIFNHCLNSDQLCRYLYHYRLDGPNRLPHQPGQGIVRRGDLWCLAGSEALLDKHEKQWLSQQRKLAYLHKWLWVFRLWPGVEMVGVTGSVAGGNPRHADDIDLVIITAPNRLWLTRLGLTLTLSILGLRRKPDADETKVADKFCLNMWLSAAALGEPVKDFYVANELARVIPVLNRRQAYQRYFRANHWLEDQLPNAYQQSVGAPGPNRLAADGPVTKALDYLDRQSQKLLRKIMRPSGRETVAPDNLRFHPKDYHRQILEAYRANLAKHGLVGEIE